VANLTGPAPCWPGADQVSFDDTDDTMKATYGYAKQGAGYGYNGVKGLDALLGTVTTRMGASARRAARAHSQMSQRNPHDHLPPHHHPRWCTRQADAYLTSGLRCTPLGRLLTARPQVPPLGAAEFVKVSEAAVTTR